MVLLSPTPQGLQKLFDVCALLCMLMQTTFVFNVKKTVCMAFLPRLFKNMILPDILLCDNVLSYVSGYKYLGFEICNYPTNSDDKEICHQYRLLCCCDNSLIRKFFFISCKEISVYDVLLLCCWSSFMAPDWDIFHNASYWGAFLSHPLCQKLANQFSKLNPRPESNLA